LILPVFPCSLSWEPVLIDKSRSVI
jgi:hypothetical protein